MIDFIEKENLETLLIKRSIRTTKKLQIGFIAFSWHELPKGILQINQLNSFINQLDLKNYGNIQQFIISLIAYPDDMVDTINDKILNEYNSDNQSINISVVLNYDFFITATQKEAIAYIKQILFTTAKSILPIFEITDFDVQQFLVDLEYLVVKKEKEEDA